MLRRRWFWGAVLLQILVLVGMMGVHGYTVTTGQPVLLKTAPVDPWDLFRGEYVILNYEISTLNANEVTMTGVPYARGQQVWVTLQAGQPYWTAVAVSAQRPVAGPEQVAVKARVAWSSNRDERVLEVNLRYGIEQFYVPEGEGLKLEQARNKQELSVEAKVDSFGRAAMSRLFVDGKEVGWR